MGRKPLEEQAAANKRILNRDFAPEALNALPRRIRPITLLDRGVIRAGMPVYKGEKLVGFVTSGTMVPYYQAEGEGLFTAWTSPASASTSGTTGGF